MALPAEQTCLRLAALDIDGTVVDSAGQVSEELKAVLARLADRGVRTVLCTGRRWRSAVPVLEELEHAHPVIVCSGGALVKRADDGRTLYSEPMPPAGARRAVRLFREAGLVPFLLYDRPLEEREVLIAASDRPRAEQLTYVGANPEAIGWYEADWPADPAAPLEVYTVDVAESVQRAAEPVRAGMGRVGIVEAMFQQRYGGELALEVRSVSATKWRALEHMLGRWGIRPEEVVAVGDDVNDVPMLEAAGLSFAMANGLQEVKDAADFVTASNDEHGAAAALRTAFGELGDGEDPICAAS